MITCHWEGGHYFECHAISGLTLTDPLRRFAGVKHFVQLLLVLAKNGDPQGEQTDSTKRTGSFNLLLLSFHNSFKKVFKFKHSSVAFLPQHRNSVCLVTMVGVIPKHPKQKKSSISVGHSSSHSCSPSSRVPPKRSC